MSFKVKLVAYFVSLALLPLAAAFVAFGAVLGRAETRVVDAQLGASLRAASAAYHEELEAAERNARAAAASPELQRALADADPGELGRLLEASPALRVIVGELEIGRRHAHAAERRVDVTAPGSGSSTATIVAAVPIDDALLARLRARSGLRAEEHLVVTTGGRIVAASRDLGGTLDVSGAAGATRLLGEEPYRVAGTHLVEGRGAMLGVLVPQARIDAAASSDRLQVLAALVAVLALIALVAYLQGRVIVAAVARLVRAANAIAAGRLDERVPESGRDEFAQLARSFNEMAEQLQARLEEVESERRRLRETTARFAGALSVTHDAEQLLLAVVETAVEATNATRGLLLDQGRRLVQVGRPGPAPDRIELRLATGDHEYGELVLLGSRFSALDVGTAELLVGHAAVALENARLHRIVERQSLVDELTELANRRSAEETLRVELGRVERHGGSVAVVVADLDGFKDVNDRHGHPCGDAVLREFAHVLRSGVREVDLAARWGGEEFLLVLTSSTAADAAHVAQRIRRALERRELLSPEGTPFTVTASFGVASSPPAATLEELVAAADAALYRAKREGKNCVVAAEERAPAGPLG